MQPHEEISALKACIGTIRWMLDVPPENIDAANVERYTREAGAALDRERSAVALLRRILPGMKRADDICDGEGMSACENEIAEVEAFLAAHPEPANRDAALPAWAREVLSDPVRLAASLRAALDRSSGDAGQFLDVPGEAQSPAPAWTREEPAEDGHYWTRTGPGAQPELLTWKEVRWLFGSERAFSEDRVIEHWPVRVEPPK